MTGFFSQRGLVAGAACGLLWLSSTAYAQDRFDASTLRPMPSQHSNYISNASSRTLEQWGFELGVFGDFADDPFFLTDTDGSNIGGVVEQQLTARIFGTFAFLKWAQLSVDVPLVVLQNGENLTGANSTFEAVNPPFGIGDLRLVPKVRFFDTRDEPELGGFAMGLVADVQIPIGDEAEYQGEGPNATELGGYRIHPELVMDAYFGKNYSMGINAGYLVRPQLEMAGIEVDDILTYGLSFDLAFDEHFHLVPEAVGSVPVLNGNLTGENVSLDLLAAARVFPIPEVMLQVGGAYGTVKVFDTPDWRVFGGVHYAHTPERLRDKDGDGINNKNDLCNDDPEDMDGFQDGDGCPDADNDGDGIVDTNDSCPNAREDLDGFEDSDGCPDTDNDADGIPDTEDRCPMEAEVINDFEDFDGCPDEKPAPLPPEVTPCVDIDIGAPVYFDYGKDSVAKKSYETLDNLVRIMNQAEVIRKVRIEGHTDSSGTRAFNLDLSKRRAASVMNYLIEHGVDASRLTSEGFGEERPIADNKTRAGRAKNRRVEVIILEQEGCD